MSFGKVKEGSYGANEKIEESRLNNDKEGAIGGTGVAPMISIKELDLEQHFSTHYETEMTMPADQERFLRIETDSNDLMSAGESGEEDLIDDLGDVDN